MALQLRKAERKKAKLKLGMSAPSGGGKTLGALFIAYGLMKEKYPNLLDKELWEKIAIIDSENGSGELYVLVEKAGILVGEYMVVSLSAPFTPAKYVEAIELCYKGGAEVCIIDSTTHLWAGVGGSLEKQGNIAKKTGNSYTAWREVTPEHNKFIDAMLQTDIHIIATMRSKTEYVQEKVDGKTIVRKVGLNPIQRDGMEYEFTVFLEVDADHTAFGSKDRTGIVDQEYFTITPEVGMRLMKWLDSGVETSTPPKVVAETKEPVKEENIKDIIDQIVKLAQTKNNTAKETNDEKTMAKIKEVLATYHSSGNPYKITKIEDAKKCLDEIGGIK